MPAKKPATPANVSVPPAPEKVEVPKEEVVKTKGGKKTPAPKQEVEKPVSDLPKVADKTPAVSDPEKAAVKTEETHNEGEVIIKDILDKMTTLNSQIKTIQTSLKVLMKEFDKQKKIIDKVQKKREKAKKSPSGFAKPCKISDELCDFMGIPKGTEQSRTDITRHINSYVKEHNLNNPENRREFFPDKKLKSILNIKDGEKVTYFVLQRLIAHHFPPSQSKLAAATKV